MIKRAVNAMFNSAILAGRKTTTIRESFWPAQTQIMLFNWTGRPYRSKQRDVAVVVVADVHFLRIYNDGRSVEFYELPESLHKNLWMSEGFESQGALDWWFLHVAPLGHSDWFLMRFCVDIPATARIILE